MKILLSHPTGNANLRAVATGLQRNDMLAAFYTTVATLPGNAFDVLSTLPPFTEFSRRRYDGALKPYTKSYPLKELGRLFASKAKLTQLIKHETGVFSIDSIYKSLDQRVASNLRTFKKADLDAVYSYEDGALFTFQEAKLLGITCLYDLPIGYWRTARKLLAAERELWPEWSSTLTGFNDSEAKLARKDEELKLSEHIFVASSFTKSTLGDFKGGLPPITIVPYGFPPVYHARTYTPVKNRPLKVLFVGGLSQRKGIANLFAAVDAIGKHVELTVVGRKASDSCEALDNALAKHTWIPSLPHAQVLELMREHDVLIFPSLFEGFGLVITEAMSQGTPVITTDRTAGPDLIENGKNGWIVEAGSTEAIKNTIESILLQPEIVEAFGKAAMQTAQKRNWEMYGDELAKAISKIDI